VIALITGDESLAILIRLWYGANAATHSKELWESKFLVYNQHSPLPTVAVLKWRILCHPLRTGISRDREWR
jgi:hypothetical protein